MPLDSADPKLLARTAVDGELRDASAAMQRTIRHRRAAGVPPPIVISKAQVVGQSGSSAMDLYFRLNVVQHRNVARRYANAVKDIALLARHPFSIACNRKPRVASAKELSDGLIQHLLEIAKTGRATSASSRT